MAEKWIHDLRGTVLTKSNAQIILRGNSKTPNCFVLLKHDKDLVTGTMTVDERLQSRVAGNESTTDLKSSETWQKPNARAGKKSAGIQCRKIAGSEFSFLKLQNIVDSLYSESVMETNQRKMAQKVIDYMHPHEKLPFTALRNV